MRKHFLKLAGLAACIGMMSTHTLAQQNEKLSENDEIIIKKKGDKNTKLTVEIKGDEITVNGKPLSDFDDDNVMIRRRRTMDGPAEAFPPVPPMPPRSPFRGSTYNFNDQMMARAVDNSNKALLGVVTEKTDNGARITNVTKGSAADKAGLKEGDIITKIDDTKIETPQDLMQAIGKYEPEQKVTIVYKRDNKEQKTNATLGKKPVTLTMPENFNLQELQNLNRNFNFDFNNRDGIMIRGNSPRLGIKAQDTEDGKGVKVLDVDDGSNAQKAGIKAGDVITEFDGNAVNTAPELAEAARDAKDKATVKVNVTRDGKKQQFEIKVPKKLKTASL